MDSTLTQQQLLDATSQAQTQTQQQIDQQINDAIGTFRPQIESALLLSALFMTAWIIMLLVSSIYKWRVERAILRIDANLKKLVQAQVPSESPEVGEKVSEIPEVEHTEQK